MGSVAVAYVPLQGAWCPTCQRDTWGCPLLPAKHAQAAAAGFYAEAVRHLGISSWPVCLPAPFVPNALLIVWLQLHTGLDAGGQKRHLSSVPGEGGLAPHLCRPALGDSQPLLVGHFAPWVSHLHLVQANLAYNGATAS